MKKLVTKGHNVSFYADDDTYWFLKYLSKRFNASMSEVIRSLIGLQMEKIPDWKEEALEEN